MSSLFNQYSYLLMSAGIILLVGLVLRTLRTRRAIALTSIIVLVALSIGGWITLRPTWDDVTSLEDAEALLSNGKPTFVEFYSQY